MSEKLIIKNFGPIKSMELDLGKITILIGEQASGKSTVAKVLAICRFFSFIVEDSDVPVNHRSAFSQLALDEWDLDEYEQDTSYIHYENPDYSVEIKKSKGGSDDELLLFKPTISAKSERFKNLLINFEALKPKKASKFEIQTDWSIPHSFLTTDVKSVMNNPFYFPTERGLQSIFSLGAGVKELGDKLLEQLSQLYRISKEFNSPTVVEPLGIEYKNANGVGYVRQEGTDRFFRLSKGASGHQSATPIILAVDYYSTISRKRTFIVEEPEQNLFPAAQKKLVDFLTASVIEDKHQMLLTTHSPYILSAIENLMYAHKMGTLEDGKYAERVGKIIDEKYWIDQKDVNVYALENGTAKSIVDREEPLIDKEYIDSVSDIMMNEFDLLLAIEVEHKNGGSK